MREFVRFLGWMIPVGFAAFVLALCAVVLWESSDDVNLPDYSQLEDYEPPVTTRVHSVDGQLLAEYARENRLFLPIQTIPDLVINAFLAGEDKNFYSHNGVDFSALARAAVRFVLPGSSEQSTEFATITQQVGRIFLLTNNETRLSSRLKQLLLAMRLERAYSKNKILELYLNEIDLGSNRFGVAAAALFYFDKSVNELTVSEAAYLAALRGATELSNPNQQARAIARRDRIIDRMVSQGWIRSSEGSRARLEQLNIQATSVDQRVSADIGLSAANYFTEELRRDLRERYGEKKLYEGGLSVRATIDPKMQIIARRALTAGLFGLDEAQGWRGAESNILPSGDWGSMLVQLAPPADIAPLRLAVVLKIDEQSARIGLCPTLNENGRADSEREFGVIAPEGIAWVKTEHSTSVPFSAKLTDVLKVGDVIYVEPGKGALSWRLRQLPEVSGAIIAMDPFTGRVLAMVGGFSLDQDSLNRATQAFRPIGSSFKLLVYAAAIEDCYTKITNDDQQAAALPSLLCKDLSVQLKSLRAGFGQSGDAITARLVEKVGVLSLSELTRRLGVYDELSSSEAHGTFETTLMRMVTAVSMFANGGRRIKPTLIDRIQDRYGHVVYKHDARECRGCDAPAGWKKQAEPILVDRREQVIDSRTAYEMTSMMVETAQANPAFSGSLPGRPLAGYDGTNVGYEHDWFLGFTPEITVAVYVGFDKPKAFVNSTSSSSVRPASRIASDFVRMSPTDKPVVSFQLPTAPLWFSQQARINRR